VYVEDSILPKLNVQMKPGLNIVPVGEATKGSLPKIHLDNQAL
jgi:hypothetical protein